ncbi:hypothetical protein KDA_41340 [Dictyobacter alpinus]|uniref:DUF4097 domain-containing protein n=1 Tax=Dictyobacter alpinus TaxID=2014873 RepID=A0A402BBI9_9CHLR|nr:DUF4097 family beta strand repeat-containing protein [Dictyobacter alpinus]GCE28650.1 hypothetical protein KDA_41340 [Dictyobacter alpinus]
MSQQQSQFTEDGPPERRYGSQYNATPIQRETNLDPREQPGYVDDYQYGPYAQGEKLRPASTARSRRRRPRFWFAIVFCVILIVGMWSYAASSARIGSFGKPHLASYASVQEYKGSTLDLQASSADIHVHFGTSDNVRVSTNNGDGFKGESDGQTIHLEQQDGGKGPFSFTNNDLDITVPAKMNLNLETKSGNIEIDNVDGKINATAASGDIKINQARIADGSNLKTESGNIDFTGNLDASSHYTFEANSGDIKVNLPASNPAKVTTNTQNGDVHNPGAGTTTASSPDLHINTNSGDISVEYQD